MRSKETTRRATDLVSRFIINPAELIAVKAQLKPVDVFFAAVGIRARFIRTHGFIVAGDKRHARTFSLRADIADSEVYVSTKLIRSVDCSSVQRSLQLALRLLEGKKFPCTEVFLRKLLRVRNLLLGKAHPDNYTDTQMLYLSAFPDAELRYIIAENKSCNGIQPKRRATLVESRTGLRDIDLFRQGRGCLLRHSVSSLTLMDVIRDQALASRFLDEKAGLGKSLAIEEKVGFMAKGIAEQRSLSDLQWRLSTLRVTHKYLPSKLKPCESNCNKTAASVLCLAYDIEGGEVPEKMSASVYSVGCNQGMRLWRPIPLDRESPSVASVGDDDSDLADDTAVMSYAPSEKESSP